MWQCAPYKCASLKFHLERSLSALMIANHWCCLQYYFALLLSLCTAKSHDSINNESLATILENVSIAFVPVWKHENSIIDRVDIHHRD